MSNLLNTLASPEQLRETPSRRDGIPADLEDELRVWGCQLIQNAGILLKLPQVAMATAQVLFQRFWYVSSFKHFSLKEIAMGVLFLSTKLEECPLRIRDLINVYDYLLARAAHVSSISPGPRALELHQASSSATPTKRSTEPQPFKHSPAGYFAASFYDSKDALVVAEMQVLKRLGFNVQVSLPYATLVNYLQMLGLADGEKHPGLAQRAWGLLNDALQTPVYALFPPHVLAASAIYLVLSEEGAPALPLNPPWWTLFDVTRAELRIVSAYILRLYDAKGLAGRVKDENGGLIELADKKGVKAWLEAHGVADRSPVEAPR